MPPRSRPRPDSDDLLLTGALALGLRLGAEQVAAFRVYREELLRWTARSNLTALRDPAEIVRAGFLDSLACLPLIPPPAKHALDIGSGPGFPALPLKLLRPDISFTLVEASRKKVSFLRHAVRILALGEVRVVQSRAEAMSQDPREAGAYDVAMARAVAPPSEVLRLVRPFLRPGGLFLAQLGPGHPPGDAMEPLLARGFEPAGRLALPPPLGLPGRVVLALRRAG